LSRAGRETEARPKAECNLQHRSRRTQLAHQITSDHKRDHPQKLKGMTRCTNTFGKEPVPAGAVLIRTPAVANWDSLFQERQGLRLAERANSGIAVIATKRKGPACGVYSQAGRFTSRSGTEIPASSNVAIAVPQTCDAWVKPCSQASRLARWPPGSRIDGTGIRG
jgi:hypothetical protein